jgi:hypothetical protein
MKSFILFMVILLAGCDFSYDELMKYKELIEQVTIEKQQLQQNLDLFVEKWNTLEPKYNELLAENNTLKAKYEKAEHSFEDMYKKRQ